MRVITALTGTNVGDRIVEHLKLALVAERPPHPHIACPRVLMATAKRFELFPVEKGDFIVKDSYLARSCENQILIICRIR